MIKPKRVKTEAKRREDKNIKFRTYLKNHADEEELDRQFKKLHEQYFKNYDCSRCRNCCKEFHGELDEQEARIAADTLKLNLDEFIVRYLKEKETGIGYITNNRPCDFLQEDGSCLLGDCKPDNCKKYPYTDQPERLHSLYSVLNTIEVCPVAYEIWEELKDIYKFK